MIKHLYRSTTIIVVYRPALPCPSLSFSPSPSLPLPPFLSPLSLPPSPSYPYSSCVAVSLSNNIFNLCHCILAHSLWKSKASYLEKRDKRETEDRNDREQWEETEKGRERNIKDSIHYTCTVQNKFFEGWQFFSSCDFILNHKNFFHKKIEAIHKIYSQWNIYAVQLGTVKTSEGR